MKCRVLAVILVAQLVSARATAATAPVEQKTPAPVGMIPCSPENPFLKRVEDTENKLGREVLGCFQSSQMMTGDISVSKDPMPVEYAFATSFRREIAIPVSPDQIMQESRKQWEEVDPSLKSSRDSCSSTIKQAIAENGSPASAQDVFSSPRCISIDGDENYFSVTYIKTYPGASKWNAVKINAVDADGQVKFESRIVYLNIHRQLNDPSDVNLVRGEIQNWARAFIKHASP